MEECSANRRRRKKRKRGKEKAQELCNPIYCYFWEFKAMPALVLCVTSLFLSDCFFNFTFTVPQPNTIALEFHKDEIIPNKLPPRLLHLKVMVPKSFLPGSVRISHYNREIISVVLFAVVLLVFFLDRVPNYNPD